MRRVLVFHVLRVRLTFRYSALIAVHRFSKSDQTCLPFNSYTIVS